jgi:hypothetical protein
MKYNQPQIILKAVFLLAILCTVQALAGPFGLEMGMKPDQLKNLHSEGREGEYDTDSPPKPHPRFTRYTLLFSRNSGLYGIVARTDEITTNDFGEQLQSVFEGLETPLTAKYGTPDKHDYLKDGSIWSEANEWMTGLVKEDRVLACFWTASKQKLPDNIDEIDFEAVGLSKGKGLVKITYWFSNSDAALAEKKAKSDSAL